MKIVDFDIITHIDRKRADLTVQTLAFTDYVSYASGVTASSSGNSLYKMGNLILLNMTFKSPSGDTFLDVATLNNSIKPRANLNIMAYDWTDNKAVGAATVGASVRLYGVTSGHDYSLNITYPV